MYGLIAALRGGIKQPIYFSQLRSVTQLSIKFQIPINDSKDK